MTRQGGGGSHVEARPGQTLIGRYRLRRVIARGGMATVWEASDERLGRLVAVKILYPHLAANSDFLERFRREALAAARLLHPNIVQVFDSGLDAGNYFIVMELLGGGSLRDAMNRRRFDSQDAAVIGVATSRALGYAHGQGVVHRDIKPANILFSPDGHLKVGDFGIAKVAEDDELTGTEDVIGTAAYLSPEQLRGEMPLPASDIYALGVVLFELVSGRRPFKKDASIAAAIARVTEPTPSISEFAPDLPPALISAIDRCLAADLAVRYSAAAQLATDLEPLAAGRTEVELPEGSLLPRESVEPSPNPSKSGSRQQTVVRPGPAPPMPGRPLTPPSAATGSTRRSPAPPPPQRSSPTGRRPMPTPPAALAPKPKRRRFLKFLILIVVLALLAAAGVVVGRRLVDRGTIPGLPGSGTPGAKVVEVSSFDPQGDGTENEARARSVIDGDRSTPWATERYGSAELGGLKSGVGLVFRFDRKAQCGSVTVHTTAGGWSGEVRVGDSKSNSIDGYRVAGKVANGGTDQKISTGSASGEYWVLWFTLLPPVAGGNRLEVTEVDFGVCG